MNRRRFLQFLGMATAGATVAYSFPDIIVPKNIAPAEFVQWTNYRPSANQLTFQKLMEAYQKCRIGNYEPNVILVNDRTFRHVQSLIHPQSRFTEINPETGRIGIRFMGARIESEVCSPKSILAKKDGQVTLLGKLAPDVGMINNYYFDIN